jgi:hypothetical protein
MHSEVHSPRTTVGSRRWDRPEIEDVPDELEYRSDGGFEAHVALEAGSGLRPGRTRVTSLASSWAGRGSVSRSQTGGWCIRPRCGRLGEPSPGFLPVTVLFAWRIAPTLTLCNQRAPSLASQHCPGLRQGDQLLLMVVICSRRLNPSGRSCTSACSAHSMLRQPFIERRQKDKRRVAIGHNESTGHDSSLVNLIRHASRIPRIPTVSKVRRTPSTIRHSVVCGDLPVCANLPPSNVEAPAAPPMATTRPDTPGRDDDRSNVRSCRSCPRCRYPDF